METTEVPSKREYWPQLSHYFAEGGPITRGVKLRTAVSVSTVDSRLMALSKDTLTVLHIRHFLETIKKEQTKATEVGEENKEALARRAVAFARRRNYKISTWEK